MQSALHQQVSGSGQLRVLVALGGGGFFRGGGGGGFFTGGGGGGGLLGGGPAQQNANQINPELQGSHCTRTHSSCYGQTSKPFNSLHATDTQA